MEVQEILEGKGKVLKFFEEKGFEREKDYSDEEYNEGTYFKIDKRKLLVVYAVSDEEKLKEIKDHFLIDRGLSYCLIVLDGKLIFFRNFGETKHFFYSERTKNNPSKTDKLKNITSMDSLFQSKDISAQFYESFKLKRNLLVQHIKNDVEPIQKYLIAQKIFDRFFFIYFLCHKGIIKFKDGKKISGENLFTKILLEKDNFLKNLKKMFHLFNSQENNLLEIGEYEIVIPYLNGGLFRPDVLEQDLDIKLKDEQWEDIFEFLNSYHWIIEDVKAAEENEEKILTPEILGHVYERSVVEWESDGFEKEAENAVKNITERKKKGVYYTPEPITGYISNNTIVPYLLDKLGNKYNSFDELVKTKNKNDMKDALKILDEIKVLDPACGSGAFLIKASEVIFGLKRRLKYELKDKKNFYDLKLDIITENIYGVDILAGAIEISKLRLWLWLISDYEENKNEIKALPNIEYNLKVGNSLVGWLDEKLVQIPLNTPLTEKVDGIFTGLVAFSENGDGEELKKARDLLRSYKLETYIEAYYILYKIYRRTHGLKAENLRSILETIRQSIYHSVTPAFLEYVNCKIAGIDYGKSHKEQSAKYKAMRKNPAITAKQFEEFQAFHWRIDFGHIILNGGFDVVIGNPPYGAELEEKIKKYFFSKYDTLRHHPNTSGLFIHEGISLIKNDRISGFIFNKNIIRSNSYELLRKKILSECKILNIVDLSKGVFGGVTQETVILILQKTTKNKNNKIQVDSKDNLSSNEYSSKINQDDWLSKEGYVFDIGTNKEQKSLLKKIETLTQKLGTIAEGFQGIIAKDQKTQIKENKINENYKKILGGKNIDKYNIQFKRKYIEYVPKKLTAPRDEKIFLAREKILTRHVSSKIIATYDNSQFYALQTINIILLKTNDISLKYLLGLLNSKLLNYYYEEMFNLGAGLTTAISIINLEKIPIKIISYFQQEPIIKLVDKMLSLNKQLHEISDKNTEERTRIDREIKKTSTEIDILIYKIYSLTPEEIKIVERFNNG